MINNEELKNLYEKNHNYFKALNLTTLIHPHEVKFAVVDGCNRACPFCAINPKQKNKKEIAFLSADIFKDYWIPAIPNSVRRVEFSVFETLWNYYTPRMIEHTRKHLPLSQISIISNCDPIKEYGTEILDECFYKGLNIIQLDLYDSNTIEWFKKVIVPKYSLNNKYGVRLIDFMSGYVLQTYHSNKEKVILYLKPDFNSTQRKTRLWHNMAGEATDNQIKKYYNKHEFIKYLKKDCTYPLKHLMVNINGDVSPCCIDNNFSIRIGNIYNNNLTDIWQGEKIQALRFLLKLKRRDLIKTCSICCNTTFRDGLYPYWGQKFSLKQAKDIVDSINNFETMSEGQINTYKRLYV